MRGSAQALLWLAAAAWCSHCSRVALFSYVISVGGTQWGRPDRAQGITTATEVTADSVTGSFITSGGGFSNRYAMPEYQVWQPFAVLALVEPWCRGLLTLVHV